MISGYLGTLPSVMWASGAMFIAMAPLLIPLAIWLYTLIFAFSSLWFTHFALAALVNLREQDAEPRPGFAAARDAVLNAKGRCRYAGGHWHARQRVGSICRFRRTIWSPHPWQPQIPVFF